MAVVISPVVYRKTDRFRRRHYQNAVGRKKKMSAHTDSYGDENMYFESEVHFASDFVWDTSRRNGEDEQGENWSDQMIRFGIQIVSSKPT